MTKKNDKSEKFPMPRRPLKKGDVIFAQDTLYRHYGIYEGDGKVIDFSASKGHETDASDACIREKSLSAFAKGRPLVIDGSVEENFSPTETVRRARSQIGKKKGEYNLATNNCEHFARECKSGKAESKQVQKVVTGAVAAAGVLIASTVAIALAKKKSEESET
ncbi:MAG TPA: hypothetical protein DCF70_01615 [Treponema sp.]|nr:hypothetical protein [Treponema sp.]